MTNLHIKNQFVDTVINLGRTLLVKPSFSGIEILYESGTKLVYNDIEEAYKLPDILADAGLFKLDEYTYVNLGNIREIKVLGQTPTLPEDAVLLEVVTDTDALDGETLVVPYQVYLDLVANSVTLL